MEISIEKDCCDNNMARRPFSIAEQQAYIDVRGLYNNISRCSKCLGPTSKICLACNRMSYCEDCYMIHHRLVVLGGHKLQNDADVELQAICTTHEGEFMKHYCYLCEKTLCILCVTSISCLSHASVDLTDINDVFQRDVSLILPLLEFKMRQLTKAALTVGQEYMKLENASDRNNVLEWLETIPDDVPKRKTAFFAIVVILSEKQKVVLRGLKNTIHTYLQRGKRIQNTMQLAKDFNLRKKINFAYLHESIHEILSCPWVLARDSATDAPRLSPNEDLCTLAKLYLQSHMLQGEHALPYVLFRAIDLPEGAELPVITDEPALPPAGIFRY